VHFSLSSLGSSHRETHSPVSNLAVSVHVTVFGAPAGSVAIAGAQIRDLLLRE
jgi:hypothetical protein